MDRPGIAQLLAGGTDNGIPGEFWIAFIEQGIRLNTFDPGWQGLPKISV